MKVCCQPGNKGTDILQVVYGIRRDEGRSSKETVNLDPIKKVDTFLTFEVPVYVFLNSFY